MTSDTSPVSRTAHSHQPTRPACSSATVPARGDAGAPGMTPIAGATPEMNPAADPASQVSPAVDPASQVSPAVDPASQVSPAVDPASQVSPAVDPASQVSPAVDPAAPEVSSAVGRIDLGTAGHVTETENETGTGTGTGTEIETTSVRDAIGPVEIAPVVSDLEPVVPDAPAPAATAGAARVNIPAEPHRPARSKMWTAKFVLLLGFMVALGAFTTDMYLPSLPEVGRDLGASPSAVHFTISATLIGGALGQFVIGPLSDRYGRRIPVLIGITVHVVASLLCVFAFGIAPLIALRIIQGIGNAAAAVVAMAVIRDKLSGPDASAVLSRLMLVIGLAPLLAPTIGGALASVWDWRAVFVALALYGVALFGIVWRFLPETLPPARRLSGSPVAVLGTYAVLLRDRTFVALALLPGLGMAAIFAYVSASPYVIREAYGLSENHFALLFALNGAGIVIGAQVNAALVRRFTPIRLVRLALPISVAISVSLVVITVFGIGGLVGMMIPLALLMGVNAFVAPNASATALSRHGERAGGAAALIGVSQFGVAGLVAPMVGLFGVTAVSMAGVICGAMIVALAVLAFGTPAYRRGGWAFEAG